MLRLRNVEKRFGDVVAVAGIDLDVPPARTLALIGASGCGKSTLLRLMLGLDRADGGEIDFDGLPVDDEHVEAIRQRVGYVIQEGGLFPHLDAAANIGLLARHMRWSAGRQRERIAELCALTHFPEDALVRRPGQLSGGQRQRVALMRALMLDPSVVLLDEPLGALDPLIRFELQTDLAEIFARLEKTVVLVTHDLGEADFLAHELVLLRDGRIEQRGDLAALRRAPASEFVARFLRAQRQAADDRTEMGA
ncbi:MAG: ATP-binding cassette domain-containing protein [Myxococcota bacterium]|jgi:osmoprotectant transport system ATP-binding protein|nr:ATP-binding cassette domain-containing protein [Myxococcota bacterium]